MPDSLKTLVAQILDIAPGNVSDDLGPANFGKWDSLKHIQLVAAVEEAYNIRLSPREIRSFRTFAELSDIVASKGIA